MLEMGSDKDNDNLIFCFYCIWFCITFVIHLIALLISIFKLIKQARKKYIDMYVIIEYGFVIQLCWIEILLVILSKFKMPTYGYLLILNSSYYFSFFILEYVNFMKTFNFISLAKVFNLKIKNNKESSLSESEENKFEKFSINDFKNTNKIEKIFLLILLSLALILLFSLITYLLFMFISDCEYKYLHKNSFSGATSINCSFADESLNIYSYILFVIYAAIFLFRGYNLYELNNVTKLHFSGLMKNSKIHLKCIIITTFFTVFIILCIIVLTFKTTRIREMYMFSGYDDSLKYDTYEIVLGTLLYSAPTNYFMISITFLNIHIMSFSTLILDVMRLKESDDVSATLLIVKNPICRRNSELEDEPLVNKSIDKDNFNTIVRPVNRSSVENSFETSEEEKLTESEKANKDHEIVEQRVINYNSHLNSLENSKEAQ